MHNILLAPKGYDPWERDELEFDIQEELDTKTYKWEFTHTKEPKTIEVILRVFNVNKDCAEMMLILNERDTRYRR